MVGSDASNADEIDVCSALDFHSAVPQDFRDTEGASTVRRRRNLRIVASFVRFVNDENLVPDFIFVVQSFSVLFFVVFDCLLRADRFDSLPIDDYFFLGVFTKGN